MPLRLTSELAALSKAWAVTLDRNDLEPSDLFEGRLRRLGAPQRPMMKTCTQAWGKAPSTGVRLLVNGVVPSAVCLPCSLCAAL